MMIRSLTVSLLFAVLALPAYGGLAYAQDSTSETPQDNPQTRQTDEAEDDYRRSQRRRSAGDIFDDIDINTRGSGTGTILGREVKAIDRLNQESRRHLNKQRAKALAEANPGEPVDAAYEPSETAKTDDHVARQEEEAWEEMMREANSGLSGTQGQSAGQGTGQGDQTGQGQAGQGQPSQGQVGQGQSAGQPGQSGQGGQSNPPSISPLRGGSASSASSIMDQLKGRTGTKSGGGSGSQQGQMTGGGQASQGQFGQGQSQQGQAGQGQSPQGQAQANAQAAAAAAAQAAADAQALSQSGADAAAQAQAQARADAAAQAAADAQAQADAAAQAAAQSDAQAQAQAAADAAATNAAAEAAAHHETMSPLERLKRDPVEREDVGGRTSASDYLNRWKKD